MRTSRFPTGRYGRGSVPYGGRANATEVQHLDLLDAVLSRHGWTDDHLAQAVGVDSNRIAKWRSMGVPNMPNDLAGARVDQCVASAGFSVKVLTITASTWCDR